MFDTTRFLEIRKGKWLLHKTTAFYSLRIRKGRCLLDTTPLLFFWKFDNVKRIVTYLFYNEKRLLISNDTTPVTCFMKIHKKN